MGPPDPAQNHAALARQGSTQGVWVCLGSLLVLTFTGKSVTQQPTEYLKIDSNAKRRGLVGNQANLEG